MASLHRHLFSSSSSILSLSLVILISIAAASATSPPSPLPASCSPPPDNYHPQSADSSLAAGIIDPNSSSPHGCVPENHSDAKEGDGATAPACSSRDRMLKVVVAWAVASVCMVFFVLGAWLMKRSIKNVAKVAPFENHDHDDGEIQK